LGYIFIYFLRGSLPWQGLPATKKTTKYQAITDKKLETSLVSLCDGYPEEFRVYIEYVRNLKFTDSPDYFYLRKLFRDLFKRKEYLFDSVYDWDLKDSDTKINTTEQKETTTNQTQPSASAASAKEQQ